MQKLNKPEFDATLLSSGIPTNFVCFSTAIKHTIEVLDSVSGSANSFLARGVKDITHQVNSKVFGDKKLPLNEIEQRLKNKPTSELSKYAKDVEQNSL
jgi:hypothetical protein